MASQIVNELRTTTDAVWARLSAQLHGMESFMERSDAPGEWTTRQVLCHLLFEPGWRPGPLLFSFATTDLPVIEIKPGQMYLTPERQMMTLRQFEHALDRHRREALAYLETLGDEDLQRNAWIPLFKPFLGTDEVTVPTLESSSGFTGVTMRTSWPRSGRLSVSRRQRCWGRRPSGDRAGGPSA